MKKHGVLRALLAAFPFTLPVMAGYIFVGIAFGMLLEEKGYGFLWAIVMSTFIYAGSMQFVAINFLTGYFSLISIALMTFMVNSRHIFYGLTMLDKFKDIDKSKKWYLIFSLTDETYSLLCSQKVPLEVDKSWFFFFIAFLNQLYWIMGSLVGSIAGSLITFNTKGIDFAMTALFVAILVEQIRASKSFLMAIIGGGATIFCYFVFGANNFILPSMLLIILTLVVFKKLIEKNTEKKRGKQE